MDATERDARMLPFLHPRPASSRAGRAGYWSSFSSSWSAGIEGLRLHDLPYTADTLATAAGGSVREVTDRLGHSTTVAAVRYQHVMADRDAAIARELNRLIEGT